MKILILAIMVISLTAFSQEKKAFTKASVKIEYPDHEVKTFNFDFPVPDRYQEFELKTKNKTKCVMIPMFSSALALRCTDEKSGIEYATVHLCILPKMVFNMTEKKGKKDQAQTNLELACE